MNRLASLAGGARNFWILIAAGLVLLLALLFAWVLPARAAARNAEKRWRDAADTVGKLQSVADRIPSERSKNDWLDYRKWLDDEAQIVENYFAERAQALTESISGQGEVKPIAFKEFYRQEVDKRRRWLNENKHKMTLANPDAAFPTYPWVQGSGYPRPEDFPEILRQYWARVKLYQILLACDVRFVKRLEVGKLVPTGDDCSGLPLQADLALAPEKINALIEALLRVSSASRDRDRPVITLNRLLIQPDAALKGLVGVQVEGMILLWKTAQPAEGRP